MTQPTSPHLAHADPQVAAAIGIARVMCILGIIYIHAWTGWGGDVLTQLSDTPQGLLRWALIDLMGRSAVPLLSIISGWLVAASLKRRGWGSFLRGKARALLLPMVAWNLIAVVLVSGAAFKGWINGPLPTSPFWLLNELFSLTRANDINVQMPFLRDLFVCMVTALLLVRLPDPALWLVSTAVLAWTVSGMIFPLMLRPSILLFFTLGILAQRHDLAAWMASRPIAFVAGAYCLLAGVQIWLEVVGIDRGVNDPRLLVAADLAMRFTTALFFWSIAWRLADKRAGAWLLRIEPYAFLLFCAHLTMIWLGGPLIGKWTGPLGAPLYPIFLLVQPALVLCLTLVLGKMLMAFSPSAASLLSGGRLRNYQQQSSNPPVQVVSV